MNKEIKLVIVSGRTIVVRSIKDVTNREISGCTSMMKQTLLIREESVIFEHFQQEIPIGEDRPPEVPTDIIKAAIKAKVPYMTTLAAAKATAEGIQYVKTHESSEVKSLQELHKEIQ